MEFTFLFIIAILIISVIIHEVSHGFVANILGDPTARLAGRLTLNPISHIDPLGSIIIPAILAILPGGIIFGWAKPVPYNPHNLKGGKWGPAMVAAAGPASNILIAILFGILARVGVAGFLPESFVAIAGMVVLINLILAIFNLVPIPPLDGSKILFAILPYKYADVERKMQTYWLLGIFLLLFVLWEFILFIVLNLAALFAGTEGLNLAITEFFIR